jgi:outer membrane protein assembly factor BamB
VFSTPEVSGNHLFIGSCAGIFYSLDSETGEPQWEYDITQDGEQTSFHGDMLITDDAVLIGTDDGEGHIYAFDKEKGSVLWKWPAGRGVSSDIVRHDDAIYAVTLEDHIVCLDLEAGEPRWQLPTGGEPSERFSMGSTPALTDERVYFGGLDGNVHALDAATGRPLWKTDVESQVVTSTLLLDDTIIVGTDYAELHQLSAKTGKTVNTAVLPRQARSHLITLLNGNLCVFLADTMWEGELAAFNPDLEMAWAVDPPDGTTFTSARPFLLDTWVLAGTSGGNLYAIDSNTGEVAWAHEVDPDRDWETDGIRVFGAHESVLFVGTISGAVYAFEIAGP